ncbi:hypothetical protein [Amycolatopsis keratiniphila]|uniref:hypothetical protein n=1 Tax=Amycolatopsis keratiniphila TaxID=129921 RepID=UPI00087D7E8E|nr:hypothetical protein [Amycolatopsis keratiniphila]OLZ50274.1 hypothetical protein BS330_28830 [Amycolatopsis keratiniphila subsp. nogabecina]SDU67013.1 hypothetical protein SAMN04489733_8047 [Amycolatopsis keratiniphila]
MTEHERLSTYPPYNLPLSVDSNIPREWSMGDPAAWSVARGILSELCHELHAAPISLLYQELTRPLSRNFSGLRITARARPQHGHDTIVIYRSESARQATSAGRWSLAVNGLIPVSLVSLTRPQPRTIARLARVALDTGIDT